MKKNGVVGGGGGKDDDLDHNSKRPRGGHQFKPKLARFLSSVQAVLKVITSGWITLAALTMIFAACISSTRNNDENDKMQSTLIQIGLGYLLILKPLASTLTVVCYSEDTVVGGRTTTKERPNRRTSVMTRIIAFAFLLSILCNQLPKWFSTFVACSALLAFGLASRQVALVQELQQKVIQSSMKSQMRKSSNKLLTNKSLHSIWSNLGEKERAAIGGMAVAMSLLFENFMVWVVSATYQPGIDGEYEPLQDNGRTLLEGLAMMTYNVNNPRLARGALQRLRDVLNIQWALVSSFAAALVCLELQLGQQNKQQNEVQSQTQQQRSRNNNQQQRTLAGLAFHATITLATARLIRTISFALTVLPSQQHNCYANHFPGPPPDQWGEWLMIGFLPQTRGGCNDLILSGHATVTSTLGCAFTSAANNGTFSIAVWTLIALDYAIESYQGLHYSVDMWLGCIVTCLLWHLTKPLEFANNNYNCDDNDDDNDGAEEHENNNNTRAQQQLSTQQQQQREQPPPPPPLDAKIIGMYAIPPALAFLPMTVVPEEYINYFLVGFTAWAGVYFYKFGITNYLQHVLLCELCFGLGCFL